MSNENTGLPCQSCTKPQPRAHFEWSGSGEHLILRLNVMIPKEKVLKEIKGIWHLIQAVAKGGLP